MTLLGLPVDGEAGSYGLFQPTLDALAAIQRVKEAKECNLVHRAAR